MQLLDESKIWNALIGECYSTVYLKMRVMDTWTGGPGGQAIPGGESDEQEQ